MKFNKEVIKEAFLVIFGSFIFCLGICLFITPVKLYNGGTLGISEIIRTLLANAGIKFQFEISGILNFMINIPLLLIAKKIVSRKFFFFTLLGIISQTIFFTLLPKVSPILNDTLTSVMIGGVMAGFGCGIALRAHGSSGGIDIVGMCLSKNHPNLSVGKVGIIVNSIIFSICALLFSLKVAIYSILYMVFYTIIVDKIHYQNIQVTATIFTRKKEVVDVVTKQLRRGVTYWEGFGGYTNEKTYIMVTALSKDEIQLFKSKIKDIDSKCFIIIGENLSVTGNFEKRL